MRISILALIAAFGLSSAHADEGKVIHKQRQPVAQQPVQQQQPVEQGPQDEPYPQPEPLPQQGQIPYNPGQVVQQNSTIVYQNQNMPLPPPNQFYAPGYGLPQGPPPQCLINPLDPLYAEVVAIDPATGAMFRLMQPIPVGHGYVNLIAAVNAMQDAGQCLNLPRLPIPTPYYGQVGCGGCGPAAVVTPAPAPVIVAPAPAPVVVAPPVLRGPPVWHTIGRPVPHPHPVGGPGFRPFPRPWR